MHGFIGCQKMAIIDNIHPTKKAYSLLSRRSKTMFLFDKGRATTGRKSTTYTTIICSPSALGFLKPDNQRYKYTVALYQETDDGRICFQHKENQHSSWKSSITLRKNYLGWMITIPEFILITMLDVLEVTTWSMMIWSCFLIKPTHSWANLVLAIYFVERW